jgi:cytochrome c-type biogenesis protein CcmH/NrfG
VTTPPPVLQTAPPAAQEQVVTKPQPPAADVKKKSAAKPKQEAAAPVQSAAQPQMPATQTQANPMDPDVRRLLAIGKRQYENGKYGQAMASFRAALELDPKNEWAQRGIAACQEARQRQSEQVLQQDQPQANQQQGNYPRWRRRQPN